MKKLIVGLGNPEPQYLKTRHNTGFILLDAFVSINKLVWKFDSKFNALVTQMDETIFLKPQTFMNKSGNSVTTISNYFDISNDQIIVVHDDIDLSFGVIKKQFGAGAAGHNGVISLIEKLGTKEFWRVRVGVGRPSQTKLPIDEWVLSPFSVDEYNEISNIDIRPYIDSTDIV